MRRAPKPTWLDRFRFWTIEYYNSPATSHFPGHASEEDDEELGYRSSSITFERYRNNRDDQRSWGLPLRHAAALHVLGVLNPDEIRSIVDEMIENGVYVEAFLDIIDSNPPTRRDVEAPFRSALQELGIPIPTRGFACWQIVEFHTLEIVEDRIEPEDGLTDMFRVIPSGLTWRQEKYGLAALSDLMHSLWWIYEEFSDDNTRDRAEIAVREAELRPLTLEAAIRWQDAYGQIVRSGTEPPGDAEQPTGNDLL